ncbi:SpoIID/LytB domain-containing protein [Evansella tamaricis]|uniref:SpoIID/LytB domain-containing protein n=1 Tax=Evansella tamaricis TaxID=2069301 RepID=A0ABS6JDA4_9BACI|nr:SpoIID/LytB domain-containing protein [Evansella tamaricis]MBU9710333.1 SpoIID/LytB domain-containing protein [Evansella tamaricis]
MRKCLTVIILFLLVFTTIPVYQMEGTAQSVQQPNVSVRLSNYLGNVNEVQIQITGNYVLNQTIPVESGKTYRIKNENGTLVMFEGTKKLHTLNEITFVPSIYNEQHQIRINNRPYLGTMKFVPQGSFVRPVNTLPMEDYIKGVVPHEMPASWNLEALKAQAIAARTYAASQGTKVIEDTVSNQVYAGYAWNQNSTKAVNDTSGQTLMFGGKNISAVYSSSNGGRTESNVNAWGSTALSYLPIKEDPHEPVNSSTTWSFKIDKTQIDLAGLDLTKPEVWWSSTKEKDTIIPTNIKTWLNNNGYPNTEIKIVSIPTLKFSDQLTSGGRVKTGDITVQFFVRSNASKEFDRNPDGTIRLHTVEFKNIPAQRIRAMIGLNIVKSYLVDKVSETGTQITVSGKGFGHGVGMSQWGARGMADKGFKVNEILSFYYPGTNLTPVVTYAPPPTPAVPKEEPKEQIVPLAVSNTRTEFDSKNNQVIVRYNLNRDAEVTISIRDSSNRLVGTLIKDAVRKAGNLAQYWTVTSVPNGTYSITVNAKDSEGQTTSATVQHTLVGTPPPSVPVITEPSATQPVQQPVATTTKPVQQAPTPTPLAKVGTRVTGKVNVSAANIRKSATTSSPIVGRATLNQNVHILGRTGDFYQVKSGSVRGFIHVNLLTINQRLSDKNNTAVIVNGRVADVKGKPIKRNKTVYVPLKGSVETLGLSYSWNKSQNRATVKEGKTTITMTLNSRNATVKGKKVKLTNSPEMLQSKVYVSLRTLNETVNAKTYWDSKGNIIWMSK